MKIELQKHNLMETKSEGIILTIDGSGPGMEGNLVRAFERAHPDVWEELSEEISYPLALGSAQAIEIHPDYDIGLKYCFIASTLHHMDTLSNQEKLKVQSQALRHVLSLAEAKKIHSVATAVMTGGWRLCFGETAQNMLKTISLAQSLSMSVPRVVIHVLSLQEYLSVKTEIDKYA